MLNTTLASLKRHQQIAPFVQLTVQKWKDFPFTNKNNKGK